MDEKKRTLYRLKKDGEYKWFKTPDTFRSFDYFEEYHGEVKKGVPHGMGEIKSEKGHPKWTYTGEWVDGKEHGNGKIVYNDGRRYEGLWENGIYKVGKDKFNVELKNYTDSLYVKETEEEETEEDDDDDELEIYDSFLETYEGEHKDGLRHGRGVLNYGKGIKYEGEFSKGLFHGKGEFKIYDHFSIYDLYGTEEELTDKFGFFDETFTQYIEFRGTWSEGVPIKGFAEIREYYDVIDDVEIDDVEIDVIDDDDYLTYKGDIDNSNKHGFGKFSSPVLKYEGHYYEGKYSGKGVLEINHDDLEDDSPFHFFCTPQSFTYEGEFEEGQFHGMGKWTSQNEEIIEGEFRNGQPWNVKRYDSNEICSYSIKDGIPAWGECEFDLNKYEGEWKNNFPNGNGVLKTGDFHYEGEWLNGEFHGKGYLEEFSETDYEGRHYFLNYEGEFKSGKKHGQGTWTSHNSKTIGEFRDDNPWNTKRYDLSGNLIDEIKEGDGFEDEE